MSAAAPFVIFALPRSRTAWIASFLTYKDWKCLHEPAVTMRSVDDVKNVLGQSNVGAIEGAAAPGWPLLRHWFPDIRAVVVRRPVSEVVRSMLAVDIAGVGRYDEALLERNMSYLSKSLDRISRYPNVLTLNYADLDEEWGCARLFEHCLPYRHDHAWWAVLRRRNIQADVKAALLYYVANYAAVTGFKAACKSEMRRLAYAGAISNRLGD